MGYHADPEKWLIEAHSNVIKKCELLQTENKNLRNELCLACGKYKEAHNGICDGCRWEVKT